MTRATLALDGPFDLAGTLRPLSRGPYDPTIRLGAGIAWLAMRARGGAVTVHVRLAPDHVVAVAWGPGAHELGGWLPSLLGLAPGSATTGDLRDAAHPVIADLARRHPGIRIPATRAVLEALVPAILEQKVTGSEARRAWSGLIRAHGETAPQPTPTPATMPPSRPLGIVDLPLPGAHARLRSVPGIGPWTAAEVAVRALGDPDAVSIGDFHLPNLVAWALAGEPRGTDERMLELLAPFAGRRALAMRLLEASGLRAPRYGPRLSPRRIEGI